MDTSHDQLRSNVASIVKSLENPPLVDENGDELTSHVKTEDGDWIKDYDAIVDPDDPGAYIYDEADEAWRHPESGNEWSASEIDWTEDGRAILGGEVDYDVEPLSASAWLDDILDIQYTVSRDREFLGARVLVAFGGPNIWVDTRTDTVEGYWWGDEYTHSFRDNIGLHEACKELWESY